MFRFNRFQFFSPDDSGKAPALGGEEPSTDSIIDMLSEDDEASPQDDKKSDDKKIDDDEEEDEPKKKDKDEEDEEEDGLKLKEDEDEEKEKLELEADKENITIDAPPRKKDITAKYPKFFSEFPFMEKMMFRDKAYSELFGSFDEAKETYEKVENFNKLEGEILSGKTDTLLKSVKENDPKAFLKIADDYLPALARVDQAAYLNVVGNTIKYTIMEMINEAKRQGDNGDPLREAALLLNQFVFMKSEFEPPRNLSKARPAEDEEDEVETEKATWYQERFESSVEELQSKTDNILKNTITEYIDQKQVMTGFVRKNAVRDALDDVKERIAEDKAFIRQIDRLWELAGKDKFSKSSLDKIKSAYLGKAKVLLPSAIKKARAEALKDLPPIVKAKKDEDEDILPSQRANRDRGPIPRNGERETRRGRDEMQKGETVSDFFMRD